MINWIKKWISTTQVFSDKRTTAKATKPVVKFIFTIDAASVTCQYEHIGGGGDILSHRAATTLLDLETGELHPQICKDMYDKMVDGDELSERILLDYMQIVDGHKIKRSNAPCISPTEMFRMGGGDE